MSRSSRSVSRSSADLRCSPPYVVDELADGLIETYRHHLTTGLPPAGAAVAAIDEFGGPGQISDAFVRQAPGRRTALILLASGPVSAACWGTTLVVGQAWTWPVPIAVAAVIGLTLLAVVAALVAAATSRLDYRRTRLAAAGGGVGLLLLDTAVPAAVLLVAPILVWPMALAIPASLTRLALTARSLPRVLTT